MRSVRGRGGNTKWRDGSLERGVRGEQVTWGVGVSDIVAGRGSAFSHFFNREWGIEEEGAWVVARDKHVLCAG